MPSQRKRIGFLPSKEIHEIIDKLCIANEFSQSKVTGLLVEEALRSKGVFSERFYSQTSDKEEFYNNFFDQEPLSNNRNSQRYSDFYAVNKTSFSENIKMMHEFIEFKYFKKVMKRNNNIIE